MDTAVQSFANLLNGIERNIIITLDSGNHIGAKSSFFHQLSIGHPLVDQQVKNFL
jgi:hypothetical protein